MTDQVQFLNEVAAHIRALAQPDAALGQSFQGDFPRCNELISGIETGHTLVGGPPPQPPTVRGHVGRLLIDLMRRSLFWYTPAIHAFQRAVAAAFREQSAALKEQNERAGTLRNELTKRLLLIEKENSSLREQLRSATETLRRWNDLDNRIGDLEDKLSNNDNFVNKTHLAEISSDLHTRLSALSEQIGSENEKTLSAQREVEAIREQLAESVNKLQALDRFTLSTRAEMILVERRTSTLLNKVRSKTESDAQETVTEPPLLSDELYYDFENLFRGSEQEIKERVKFYVPRFAETGLGTPEMPIVDIGCGRGEWLDILREHRLLAYGVDGNSSMIATCREKGLAVEEQDGIQYLKGLPAGSVGAVTAFHFIEHLPFGVLLSFIDEVLRVLKPGGMALFETPNPDNLLVGACTFYIDPTHQKPIPSGLLKFLMQSRGFASIEVLPLHPYPSSYYLDPALGSTAQVLNERLFGCQDYAVMALRP